MRIKKLWSNTDGEYGFGMRSTGFMKKMVTLLIGAAAAVTVVACSSNTAGAPSPSAVAMVSPAATAVVALAETAAVLHPVMDTVSPAATAEVLPSATASASPDGGTPITITPVSQAPTNRVRFPANFDQMVMYGDYRRGSGGELAYALPETIDTAKAGQPLPAGTVLVLEIYNNNVLTAYFVSEKGVNWGLDFPEEVRTGDWHFQEYDTTRQVSSASNPGRCMSCHGGQARNDFMFTLDRMRDYKP